MGNRESTLTDYTLEHKIGEGIFGDVLLGRNTKTGEIVAMKRMKKKKLFYGCFKREIEAARRLKHPLIVDIKDSFLSRRHMWLVMEYIDGYDLVQFMRQRNYRPMRESKARVIFQQILKAVQYCHQVGIAHRDIKLENILIDKQGNIKLIDFGLCCTKDASKCRGRVGSPEYCCPEVMSNGREYYDGFKADSWSCGVTLHALLLGRFPFEDEQLELLEKGVKVEFKWPSKCSLGSAAKDLILKLMEWDPEQRISVKKALEHPWFNGRKSTNMKLTQNTWGKSQLRSYESE